MSTYACASAVDRLTDQQSKLLQAQQDTAKALNRLAAAQERLAHAHEQHWAVVARRSDGE